MKRLAGACPRRKVFSHNSKPSLTKQLLSMFKHWGEWSFTKEKLTDRVLGIDGGYHWEVEILIASIVSGFSIFQKK